MDKKFEDKIAKMAFGELTEAEAAEVRAHTAANADAARALDSYEALRSDLRRMKDIPPDQLSKERLQNAILGQGLQPKPVRRTYPWAWATPVAVMGALAMLMFARTPEQKVVFNTEPQPSKSIEVPDASAPKLNFDEQRMLDDSIEDFRRKSSAEVVAPAPVAPTTEKHEPRSRSNRVSPRAPYVALASRKADPSVTMARTALSDKGMSLAPADPSSDSLVLIQSDTDNDTGASTAVEVKSTDTQDVIVSS